MELNVEHLDLEGHTVLRIEKIEDVWSKEVTQLRFYISGSTYFQMYHEQDCCEVVYLNDINGSLDDLIGSPILKAEKVESDDSIEGQEDLQSDSFTWTFYKLATEKGYVTLRWIGMSNGYYSESVSLIKVTDPPKLLGRWES